MIVSNGVAIPLDTKFDINDLEPASYPDRIITKKDIFTSRGWGAAGMPYSLYYVGKPLQARSGAQQTMGSNYFNEEQDIENGNFEALRSEEASNDEKVNKSNKNSKYVIPQLFVSYGWGPMG